MHPPGSLGSEYRFRFLTMVVHQNASAGLSLVGRAPGEPSFFRTRVTPEVPLPDERRMCTRRCLKVRGVKSRGLCMQLLAGYNGVGDPVAELVHACQQRGPGGRAGWADIKIVKAYTFGTQADSCGASLNMGGRGR